MVLYFSATGNSEYVAKYIADKVQDKVVNITTYLKNGERLELESDKPYLVVCPIYLSTIPTIVYDKLMDAKLGGNKNLYFIMTCAGSGKSAAQIRIKKIATKLEMTYRGVIHLSMPQDYLMYFTVGTKEENDEKFNKAISKLDDIVNKLNNNEDFIFDKVSLAHKASIKPVEDIFDGLCIKPKKFYTTTSCISCGLCAKLCPLNNITLVNKKPTWGKKCIHCTACINNCPKKAIEYGKKTIGKNRYTACKFIEKNNK
jgi:ferredoxin